MTSSNSKLIRGAVAGAIVDAASCRVLKSARRRFYGAAMPLRSARARFYRAFRAAVVDPAFMPGEMAKRDRFSLASFTGLPDVDDFSHDARGFGSSHFSEKPHE
jgi:hypothetical protein